MDAHARLLAVEVLLADPQSLGNDALETDLYILRDQLRAGPDPPARQLRTQVRGSPSLTDERRPYPLPRHPW